ncbi:MAG: glycine cleavage system protein T [Chloroflexi bacterium]|nr:glycine cleavage system protein T [Chloroflexota bacterium]
MQATGTTRMFFYPRIRKSPYFESTQRYGATVYNVYNHMYHPIAYGDLVEEYWKLRHDVTVWDVAVERIVEISGPDGFAFTNLLTPRDLTKCAVGECKYVLITDENGGIINDPVLLRLGENHFWLALADSDVLLWAKGVAINSGMNIRIAEPDVSAMQIQGPKSKPVVRALFGEGVSEMPYYRCVEAALGDIPVIVSRTGWSGEVGYEIYLRDGSRGDELWERVMEAGKPHNIAPIAPSEIRRMEAGILNYGADMTLDDNPYEVGLGWLVDLDKEADFIGRSALKRIKAQGVKRKLVGVEIEGEPVPGVSQHNEQRWPVVQSGARIGYVPDAIYSPSLKKNIGYAMVPVEYGGLGTKLVVNAPWGPTTARVVKKPFVDPSKDIPKA